MSVVLKSTFIYLGVLIRGVSKERVDLASFKMQSHNCDSHLIICSKLTTYDPNLSSRQCLQLTAFIILELE